MSTDAIAAGVALRRLIDEYAFAIDTRDPEAFVALFAPDGALVVYEPGESDPVVSYTGAAELTTVLGLVAAFDATFHVMANHVSNVDGERATARTYCLAHHLTEGDGPAVDTVMLIRYDDAFAFSDGRWLFVRRDVMRQWTDTATAERARLKV
jgi:hypothetical protein